MYVQHPTGSALPPCQSEVQSAEFSCLGSGTLSSIHSLKTFSYTDSLFASCFAPIRAFGRAIQNIILFLRNKLCCCKCGGAQDKIDYLKTKRPFAHIHGLVVTKEENPNFEKELGRALRQLSKPAMERFKEHIGFAIAAHQSPSIEERQKQEAWVDQNRSSIEADIDECFKNSDCRPKLKMAVESFWKEIQRQIQAPE